MNNKKILAFTSIVITSLSLSTEVQATIYKCVNSKDKVYYNDKPCPVNDKESQFKAVKDPVGGYIPPEIKENKSDVVSRKVADKEGKSDLNDQNTKTTSQSVNQSEYPKSSSDTVQNDSNKSDKNGSKVSLSQTAKSEIKKPTELIFH